MADLWKLWVVLGGAAVLGSWLLAARALRRKRCVGLEAYARELGLFFHGSSFRGQFEGHAVRGDGGDEIPRKDVPGRSHWLALFSVGRKAVRVRVELTSPGLASPDGGKAAAAARRELKGRGLDAGLYDVALQGTEVVFVLRDEAARPEVVRRLVKLAIEAAGPA